MQKYFLDLKGFVEERYPAFQGNIVGGHYPPPQYATVIATIAGYIWILGIITLVAGQSIFKNLGIPEPEIVTWMSNNRAGAFFMLFMINSVASSLLATGAFEVYIDDDLVFSKLQTKRFPSPRDLVALLSGYGHHMSEY